jgi:hypothetical protein
MPVPPAVLDFMQANLVQPHVSNALRAPTQQTQLFVLHVLLVHFPSKQVRCQIQHVSLVRLDLIHLRPVQLIVSCVLQEHFLITWVFQVVLPALVGFTPMTQAPARYHSVFLVQLERTRAPLVLAAIQSVFHAQVVRILL